jgi:flagellar basal-body rod protein FlgB
MFEKLELTRMAQAMASHAGARLGVVAANIAHADSPGYKARDLPDFAEAYRGRDAMRTTRAGHLGDSADASAQARIVRGPGSPNGNTVSLETEMVRGVEVRQHHEMALAVYRVTSEIVRASLGRRG